ncbi:MAG: polysaccharide deacetylase family protein [Bacteroidales bacterium]|nr:polysaccharide deacetylase family protein [Bacteroidales bacterium]
MKTYFYLLGMFVLLSLAQCQKSQQEQAAPIAFSDKNIEYKGGIVRGDTARRALSFVFTAHDHADGADSIISVLGRHGVKGAFFFTGLFYDSYPEVIERLKADGHYLGSHSNGHLLYMPWDAPDSLLMTKQEFTEDMLASYEKNPPPPGFNKEIKEIHQITSVKPR